MAGTHDELLAKKVSDDKDELVNANLSGLPAVSSPKHGELEAATSSAELRRQQTAVPVVSAVRRATGPGGKDSLVLEPHSSPVNSGASLSRVASMPTTMIKRKQKKLTSYKGLWEAATGGNETDMTVAAMEQVRAVSSNGYAK